MHNGGALERIIRVLTLIDEEKELTRRADWINPIDDTGLVRQLGKSGSLRMLQVINCKLKYRQYLKSYATVRLPSKPTVLIDNYVIIFCIARSSMPRLS